MVNIFNYLDYRDFLRDFYTDKKKEKPFFSYRYISSHVGVDSSYLVKVLQGNRHISSSKISNFIKLLKMNDKEGEFFELLVCFCKAKTEREKQVYHHKLEALSLVQEKREKSESRHLLLNSKPGIFQAAIPRNTSMAAIPPVMVWNQDANYTPFTTNRLPGTVEQKTAMVNEHFIAVDSGLGIMQSKPQSRTNLKMKKGKSLVRNKTFSVAVTSDTGVDKQPLTFSRTVLCKIA